MSDHFHACVRCGQTVITRADPPVCRTCRAAAERTVQTHESMRLFAPVDDVMPGQTGMEL